MFYIYIPHLIIPVTIIFKLKM